MLYAITHDTMTVSEKTTGTIQSSSQEKLVKMRVQKVYCHSGVAVVRTTSTRSTPSIFLSAMYDYASWNDSACKGTPNHLIQSLKYYSVGTREAVPRGAKPVTSDPQIFLNIWVGMHRRTGVLDRSRRAIS